MELDRLDQLCADAFDGYIVRKDLVRKFARQYPVPTFVCEFLLGRYCASTSEDEIQEGLQIVERQLRDRAVRSGEEELFKSRAKDVGSVKLIDIISARLDAKTDSYVASLPSLQLKDVSIDDQLGTGKSHLFQQISPYAHLVSGGKATVARMFVNMSSGQRGLVCQYDMVCFDEVSGVSFDQKDGVNIMKGYMESGEFSRGEADLEWAVRLALECRRRVKEQQKRIGTAEFRNTQFSYTLGKDGVEKFVVTPELRSEDQVGRDPLPSPPARSGRSARLARTRVD